MSLAHSSGPRWVRSQKAEQEKALSGVNPIRQFLAALFGRSARSAHFNRAPRGPGDVSAAASPAVRRSFGIPVADRGIEERLEHLAD